MSKEWKNEINKIENHQDTKNTNELPEKLKEKIINKVEDINKEGLGYSTIFLPFGDIINETYGYGSDEDKVEEALEESKNKLFSIFKDGILGQEFFPRKSRADAEYTKSAKPVWLICWVDLVRGEKFIAVK